MRRGELKARERLVEAVLRVVIEDLRQTPMGVDTSLRDEVMLDAAKDYVNTVVGPNMGGDRC